LGRLAKLLFTLFIVDALDLDERAIGETLVVHLPQLDGTTHHGRQRVSIVLLEGVGTEALR